MLNIQYVFLVENILKNDCFFRLDVTHVQLHNCNRKWYILRLQQKMTRSSFPNSRPRCRRHSHWIHHRPACRSRLPLKVAHYLLCSQLDPSKNYVLTALSSNCVVKCARQTSPACRATRVTTYCKRGASVSLLRAGQNCPARWTNCPFALENVSYTKMRKKDTHQTVHSAANVRARSRSSVPASTTMRHAKAYAHVITTRTTPHSEMLKDGGGLREDARKEGRHEGRWA